jgi:hypothetical protein
MKTQLEVENKIITMRSYIDILHEEREDKINVYGGVTTEENEDFHSDISNLTNDIKMLEWVLKDKEVNIYGNCIK